MSDRRLTIFISSKMDGELAAERQAARQALSDLGLAGWLWETDAGARPTPIHVTYLDEVDACDIYLGIFWQAYGPGTIEEYDRAVAANKPRLVYEKHVAVDRRSPELASFLANIQARANAEGVTPARFTTAADLAEQVKRDVMRLLEERFRATPPPPPAVTPPLIPSMNVTASGGGIAIGHMSGGTINQNTGTKRDQ